MQAVTKMFPKLLIALALAIMLGATGMVQAQSTTTARASVRLTHLKPSIAVAKPSWNQMNVPQHSAWAKNVLLIVVWIFVLAVLMGPLVKYAANRKPLPRPPVGGAW